MNYNMTGQEYQDCLDAGIPRHMIGMYNVEDGDDYLTREYYENRLIDGMPVPDERIPDLAGRWEKALKYQSKMMYDIEGERVNAEPESFPDKYQKSYDDDEIVYDEDAEEWIPEWMFDNRVLERSHSRLRREYDEIRMKFLIAKYELKLRNHLLKKSRT